MATTRQARPACSTVNARTPCFRPVNPRAAERAATCLFLCSIVGSRGGGRQGASELEVKAATFVPDAALRARRRRRGAGRTEGHRRRRARLGRVDPRQGRPAAAPVHVDASNPQHAFSCRTQRDQRRGSRRRGCPHRRRGSFPRGRSRPSCSSTQTWVAARGKCLALPGSTTLARRGWWHSTRGSSRC